MKIVCDLDSIVVDLMTPWIASHNAVHVDDATIETFTSWDMHRHVAAGVKIYSIINQPGFFRHLQMLPGAEAGLKELVGRGHEVWLVTAASFACNYGDKVEWMAQYLPFIPKQQTAIMHAKHEIHADVLIDDGPHNAEAYRRAHPKAKILTIGYPYNKNCPDYDVVAGSYKDTEAAWKIILQELS
jgi:5'(3')-deoxyribonucleotidase